MSPPILVIFGGLPGTGKTTVARELARQISAIHLRVDTIEHAITSSGCLTGPVNDLGYRVAYALAADNLRLGNTVIADSVNPIAVTRAAWRRVAKDAGVPFIEAEMVCSNPDEHRRRVETRVGDIPGFTGPTWQEVTDREYEPLPNATIQADSAVLSTGEIVERLREAIERVASI